MSTKISLAFINLAFKIFNLDVNRVKHNVRVASYGPRDPGSNLVEDRYSIELKSIIQVCVYK